LVFEYTFLVILGVIDSELIFHVKTAKRCKRIKKIITIGLFTTLFITIFAATVLAQAIQPNAPSTLDSIEPSNSNATLLNSQPPLAPLKIPCINITETGPEPTLPPFDPAKATPVNMTQVQAEMAENPISDPNHMVPVR
jgi:hypothetical protein